MGASRPDIAAVPFVLAVVLAAACAWAAPPTSILCVVRSGTPPGLEPAPLDGALSLEQRKWGIAFRRVDADSLDACAPPDAIDANVALVVGPGESALVRGRDGTRRPLDLSAVDVRSRAQDVALTVMREFPRTGRPAMASLVESKLPAFPRPRPAPGSVLARPSFGAYVQVGGWYTYQTGPGLHAAGPEVEGGLTWLEERVALGIRLGWQPSSTLAQAPVPTRVQAVPVSVTLHAGVRLASVRVRVGLEIGAEWRRITAGPAGQAQRTGTGTVALLGGEVDVVVPVGTWLRLGGGVLFRGYLGGDNWDWHGRTAYAAPRFGVGGVLRIGLAVPIGKGG
jgi:hypothetical protein